MIDSTSCLSPHRLNRITLNTSSNLNMSSSGILNPPCMALRFKPGTCPALTLQSIIQQLQFTPHTCHFLVLFCHIHTLCFVRGDRLCVTIFAHQLSALPVLLTRSIPNETLVRTFTCPCVVHPQNHQTRLKYACALHFSHVFLSLFVSLSCVLSKICSSVYRQQLFVALMMHLSQQFSGINAVSHKIPFCLCLH